MSDTLRHPALDGPPGVPLAAARPTDQGKVALVLQGAGLLAQLEHAGLCCVGGWDSATVAGDVLKVTPVAPGRGLELPQVALRRLLLTLFRSPEVAGRGQARRAARHLLDRWSQTLVPGRLDSAITDIFDAAPFLWQKPFAEARTALLAEHADEDAVDAGRHLWLAGPGGARRRFLAAGEDYESVRTLLADDRAVDLWEGWSDGEDPQALTEAGRWRRAVAAWRRRPPRGAAETLAHARALYALGRYSQALAVLRGTRSVAARILRAWCQYYLGELNAALGTVRRLAPASLKADPTVELAEVAVRVLGARGLEDEIRDWVTRARASGGARPEVHLLAAEAAWDCRLVEKIGEHLEAARAALDDPRLAARWHRARTLLALAIGDGAAVVEHLGTVLRDDRRKLHRADAGRVWSDLAYGRVLLDDLPGAERAGRHALRLLTACEGPSRTTLALYNLAEIRLRRGQVAGVAESLEASTAANRRSGNLRALLLDLELWVRYELTRGRPGAALARCAEAQDEIASAPAAGRAEVFDVLAARAHGWLGRRRRAAAALDSATDAALAQLEPEERPALWALAGRSESAISVAAGTPWEPLFQALAVGAQPPTEAWRAVDRLEPYRAARLVFDCELLRPGTVPALRVRRAIDALRGCGAEGLAERLESRSLSPWRALATFLERVPADGRAVARLFSDAGRGDIRLRWLGAREIELVGGDGGSERLAQPLADGVLELTTTARDATLDALFAVVRERWRPPRRQHRAAPSDDGIIGTSSALTAVLDRLDRLAASELPILLLGESGTGKELLARRAHQRSRRVAGPFLPINCAALSETLIQSDLFGHVRGAFTGADRDRAGVFEAAHAGTVFLDEIGDLPPSIQGQLLRVLQEGEIRRVGESFARKVDARIVAATHRDLERQVAAGRLRQDLYFRLRVATVHLPPLRERGRDVLALSEHFLAQLMFKHEHPSQPPTRLTADARQRLLSHTWPGNVRELRNVLEVAATLAGEGEIEPRHLELPEATSCDAGDYHRQVEELRRRLIRQALAEADGNRAEAARRLGLSRQALSYLIPQLGL